MKKSFITLLILFSLINQAIAEEVILACPATNQIVLQKENLQSPVFNATAYAQILQGSAAEILMYGDTTIDEVTDFDDATYYRGDIPGLNDFICQYHGKKPDGKVWYLTLAEYAYTPTLANCHFKDGDPFTCSPGKDSCQLVCNVDS